MGTTAPSDASPDVRTQIYAAIRNADKAGDSAAVRKLGDYLKTIDQAPKDLTPSATATMAEHQERLARAEKELRDAQDVGGPSKIAAVLKTIPATLDVGASLAANAVMTPAAGVAGAAALPFVGAKRAADIVQKIQGAAYTPKTEIGQDAMKLINKPFQYIADKSDAAGQFAANVTGSPAVGALVNGTIQTVPALLSPEVRSAFRTGGAAAASAGRAAAAKIGLTSAAPSAASAATGAAATVSPAATAAAQNYVANRLGLDWNALADATRQKLAAIAQSAGALDQLDPAAVARQARLEALGLPATRGQVTRNLAQLTREENITKGNAGAGIRDINAAQDEILHGHIDTLRGSTGSAVTTREGLGKSVQGALRGKADALEADYHRAYADAREQGALAEPADVSPLQDWLKNPTNARNAGYLKQAIQDYLPKGADGEVIPGSERRISINDLEEIRKEAAANQKKPGPEAHFAGEAIKVIDGILDDAGGDLYKTARQKFRDYKSEFDRQGGVAKLVNEKGYTTDRAVALEDTLDHVLRAPSENIADIKASLTEGGTAATRAQGAQAWKDIQAGVLDKLKEAAAGKRAIQGDTSTAAGQKAFANNKELLQFNSNFRDVFAELDKDGKIDAIFEPKQAAMLRSIYDAVGDVRTKPTGRISGSDTVPRAIAMLESLGNIAGKAADKVPLVGKMASAGVQGLYDLSRKRADAQAATTTPLNEAVARAAGKASRQDTYRRAKGAAPLVPLSELQSQPNAQR